jgi:hypothetical protein
MRWLRDLPGSGRAALAALGLSAIVLGAVARNALTLEALPGAQEPGPPMDLPEPVRPPAPLPQVVIAAVERDPFSASRQRATDRYRLPGEAPLPGAAPRAAIPMIQLHGVITTPNGDGLAALYAMGRTSQVVRVGQVFEGFRLERITGNEVVLVGQDTTLTLRLRGR